MTFGWIIDALTRRRASIRRSNLLKTRPGATQLVRFRGATFFASPGNKIEAALLNGRGSYDCANQTVVSTIVTDGASCFDIGANIGIYSVVMAKLVGPGGQVHSFEPVPHILEKFRMNLRLNALKNVAVQDFALGEKAGHAQMYQVKEGEFRAGTSTLVENDSVEAMGRARFNLTEVSVSTLDGYVETRGIRAIDFIKIDVEGFELSVLKGGKASIRSFQPPILMEYDPSRHGKEAEGFRSFFDELGYRCFEFFLVGGELILAPFAFDRMPDGRNVLCYPAVRGAA